MNADDISKYNAKYQKEANDVIKDYFLWCQIQESNNGSLHVTPKAEVR